MTIYNTKPSVNSHIKGPNLRTILKNLKLQFYNIVYMRIILFKFSEITRFKKPHFLFKSLFLIWTNLIDTIYETIYDSL